MTHNFDAVVSAPSSNVGRLEVHVIALADATPDSCATSEITLTMAGITGAPDIKDFDISHACVQFDTGLVLPITHGVVPEPSALVLFASGVALLGLRWSWSRVSFPKQDGKDKSITRFRNHRLVPHARPPGRTLLCHTGLLG